MTYPKRETGSRILPPQEDNLLLQSEKRFRLIIENFTQYAFITIDKEGVIQSWDGGAQMLLQYSAEEAIGKPFSMLFTEHDIQQGDDKREILHAEKYGFAEDERWHVRKDGSSFWGSGIVVPLLVEERMVGFGKIFRDRTEHTLQERRKDDFLGIAGHELRNPLSILKSNIEIILLMPEVANDPPLVEIHQSLNEQIDRLSNLINDLLDLSKIASGQLRPNKEHLDIKRLIEDVANNYQAISFNHAIMLLEGQDVNVPADKNQMIQVLNNLISNAIKYSPKANKIEISLYNKPDHALVCIKDYGLGISEEEKNKIFERFYRVDNKHQAATGLGIGLYVSLEIVKAHGGTMWVESTPGEGSTFYFTIPKS